MHAIAVVRGACVLPGSILDAWERPAGEGGDADAEEEQRTLPPQINPSYRSDPNTALDPTRCECFLVKWQAYPHSASTWEHGTPLTPPFIRCTMPFLPPVSLL